MNFYEKTCTGPAALGRERKGETIFYCPKERTILISSDLFNWNGLELFQHSWKKREKFGSKNTIFPSFFWALPKLYNMMTALGFFRSPT